MNTEKKNFNQPHDLCHICHNWSPCDAMWFKNTTCFVRKTAVRDRKRWFDALIRILIMCLSHESFKLRSNKQACGFLKGFQRRLNCIPSPLYLSQTLFYSGITTNKKESTSKRKAEQWRNQFPWDAWTILPTFRPVPSPQMTCCSKMKWRFIAIWMRQCING